MMYIHTVNGTDVCNEMVISIIHMSPSLVMGACEGFEAFQDVVVHVFSQKERIQRASGR